MALQVHFDLKDHYVIIPVIGLKTGPIGGHDISTYMVNDEDQYRPRYIIEERLSNNIIGNKMVFIQMHKST